MHVINFGRHTNFHIYHTHYQTVPVICPYFDEILVGTSQSKLAKLGMVSSQNTIALSTLEVLSNLHRIITGLHFGTLIQQVLLS